MKLPRRRFLQVAGAAFAASARIRRAAALDYPTRPVHLLVGFPPGGINDITARLIGAWLSERLGQQFVIDNRLGAGSNLAAELVARANPDGYTLLSASAVNAWNTAIYSNLNYDFIRDIVPVAIISRSGAVMEVNLSFPARTVPDFIAYAKANPGTVNMATGGPGSGAHLYGELFKTMAGVDLVTVHYRGSGPALPDLISGRTQVTFDPIASSIEYIRAGKLRPLGVTTATRMDVLPDVPPIGDFVPGYVGTGWNAIGAPVNTPPEIIAILNREVNAAVADPKFRTRLGDLGVEPFSNSTDELRKFVVEYTEKWAKVIRSAGIKAE